ncbi:MAG: isoprenylcysteine carboxylmethyltransferase family protein [Deltaproteobacteria bacterium]|nr:isoprenylcysteine carboxylmethyltransferase family protein [Deltaproteobacteria bacterium]
MSHDTPSYGLWFLVLINSAVFILFAFSFAKPATRRDWRSFGAFSAFIVALFAEMYGFPLTIYLLSGWLQSRFPALDVFSHDSGHLWNTMLGLKGDPHLNPIHILSNVLIFAGFLVLYAAWKVLYAAQKDRLLATEGPYAYVRHPQYMGFIFILLGFLVQWPTLLTLLMFPVLVTMYVKLARREEREARDAFGDAWDGYAAHTPPFIPDFGRNRPETGAERREPRAVDAAGSKRSTQAAGGLRDKPCG